VGVRSDEFIQRFYPTGIRKICSLGELRSDSMTKSPDHSKNNPGVSLFSIIKDGLGGIRTPDTVVRSHVL
jgi:hypothetical protein